MTTQATKRMRIAALGLSTALSVGVLAPFIGTAGASAATDCATAYSSYQTSNSHLTHDQAKLKHFKKKLKKDKKHHRSAAVIHKDKKKVHKWHAAVKADKRAKTSYYNAYTTCSNNAAAASANPLSSLLSTLTGSGLSPSALTDALHSAASQISASGAPGAAQFASLLDQLASAIQSGSGSLDPSQLQSLFSQFTSAGFDPTAIQQAIQDAVAKFQAAFSDPSQFASNPAGLVDLILGSLAAGLTQAGVPGLPGVITQLDTVLGGLVTALVSGDPSQIQSAVTSLLGSIGVPTP